MWIYLLVIALGIKDFNWVGIIITAVLALLYPGMTLYDAVEKAESLITKIEVTDEDFLVSVLIRNELEGYSVPIKSIRTHLEYVRTSNRYYYRYNLKLTLSNYDNHFLSQYSSGTKRSDNELNNIVYQISEVLDERQLDLDRQIL